VVPPPTDRKPQRHIFGRAEEAAMLRQTHQRNPLLSVLTVLLLAALACGGAGRPGPEDSIVGKWQREDGISATYERVK
jgi:hypothetical protein